MLVVEQDAEAPIGQDFLDQAIERQQIFFRHSGDYEIHGRLLAALVSLDLIIEALILIERGKPGALDGADVDEAVRSAGIRRNEAIAFGGIEEFDGACWHGDVSFHENK